MVKNARQLLTELKTYWDRADREQRDLSYDEREEVEALLHAIKAQKSIDDQLAQFGAPFGELVGQGVSNPQTGGGPGDRFIQSKAWKNLADPNMRGQSWTTGPVEVGDIGYQTKAGTLLEGGQGAGMLPVPQVAPGIVTTLFQPVGIADLFQQGVATTSSVRVVVEGTATNLAAGVAEGGTKPASDIALSTVDEKVMKIATVLTISDEIAEDSPALQNYLNSRLTLFCQMEEDRQLLRGLGSGSNEVLGIFGRSGINTYTRLAIDDNAVCLARVIANTAGSANLQPDTIIMHPSNWLTTRLLRDGTGGTAGQFYGGGPFTGAYGNPGAPGMFGGQLWGVNVFLNTTVGSGTALVGSFQQGAQLWRRGGVTVEISNSHASYFQQNLLMVRSESRRALAVYRANAFTAVSGLA